MALAFDTAKKDFLALLTSLKVEDRTRFIDWVQDEWYAVEEDPDCPARSLKTIAEDIKSMVPLSAIFPSEKIVSDNLCSWPSTNPFLDCKIVPPKNVSLDDEYDEESEPTVHVDSFLFEDHEIHALVQDGKLNEFYCRNCLSTDVAPLTFVSHSASIDRVIFIFKHMVPRLQDKVVLDVGSRLGAVLYGAFYCSAAKKIIGVELNEDLCKIQQAIVSKYKMQDRVEVVCSDICSVPAIVQEADVVILNNVFEYFLDNEAQAKAWKWLRDHITKPGVVLITVPSLEKSLKKLETGIDLDAWIERIPIKNVFVQIKMEEQSLLSEICRYVVK